MAEARRMLQLSVDVAGDRAHGRVLVVSTTFSRTRTSQKCATSWKTSRWVPDLRGTGAAEGTAERVRPWRVRCAGPKWSRDRPARISEQTRERICLIATTVPAEWGIGGRYTWSLRTLAEHLVARGVVAASTCGGSCGRGR